MFIIDKGVVLFLNFCYLLNRTFNLRWEIAMNEITAIVEKITKGTKSGTKAREIVANFFEENDGETNWKFIIAFREKIHTSRVGRRAKKKIAEIDEEILNYICNYEKTTGTELDEMFEEITKRYNNIFKKEIKRKLEEEKDIPLIFIPLFQEHKEVLIILYEANIETLNQLISCEQSILTELFRYNYDALSDLVLFFKPMGIEFKIATA